MRLNNTEVKSGMWDETIKSEKMYEAKSGENQVQCRGEGGVQKSKLLRMAWNTFWIFFCNCPHTDNQATGRALWPDQLLRSLRPRDQ